MLVRGLLVGRRRSLDASRRFWMKGKKNLICTKYTAGVCDLLLAVVSFGIDDNEQLSLTFGSETACISHRRIRIASRLQCKFRQVLSSSAFLNLGSKCMPR